MKSDIKERFILQVKPKEYLTQGKSYCGMYTIKGILSAYGKDDKKDIKDYSLSPFGKYTGFTLPWTLTKILNKYGLKAKVGFLKNNSNKASQLKKLLTQKNAPMTLLVGNGNSPSGYSSRKARITFHWITVWGYDDSEETFYVYDSAIPKSFYDKDIPIGNKKRTYNELTRDISSTILLNNLYIAIN